MAQKNRGYIKVEVGRLPGTITEIALDGDRTVGAALRGAGLDVEDNEVIRVNNEVAELDDKLEEGDAVILVEDITGN